MTFTDADRTVVDDELLEAYEEFGRLACLISVSEAAEIRRRQKMVLVQREIGRLELLMVGRDDSRGLVNEEGTGASA